VCYIQQWRHHFKSGRAGNKLASEINFALHLAESSPMWTLLPLGPFIFTGRFTCMGPFRFRVALLHLYKAFHYHMGLFHPVRPSPWSGRIYLQSRRRPPLNLSLGGGLRTVCAGSANSVVTNLHSRIVQKQKHSLGPASPCLHRIL